MTVEEILRSAVLMINQEDPPLTLGLDRLNTLLKLANFDYFKLWCGLPEEWQPGQPVTKRGWQIAAQNTEALKPFLVPTANYVVNGSGQLNYPANFVHLSTIGYYNSSTSRWRPVEIINHEALYDRLGNVITAPEAEYPIVVYESTYFQFYPTTLGNVNMSYLRLPTTPVYAIKQENGVDVYDSANSVQFEWAEKYHPDLVRMIVSYLAPATKDGNMTTYIESKKLQGV